MSDIVPGPFLSPLCTDIQVIHKASRAFVAQTSYPPGAGQKEVRD